MRNGTNGFTLIEVLIALAILAIVTTFLSASIISNWKVMRQSQESLKAKAFAQGMLELYRTTWSDKAKYIARTAPKVADINQLKSELPPKYATKTPAVVISNVALNDGTDYTFDYDSTTKSNFARLTKVSVTVYNGNTAAFTLSTQIGVP